MKKTKRVMAFILAIVMIVPLLAVGAMADSTMFFTVDWQQTGSDTVTATISPLRNVSAKEFAEDISFSNPCLVVEKDGSKYDCVCFQSPVGGAKTVSVTYTVFEEGEYEFHIENDFGYDGLYTGDSDVLTFSTYLLYYEQRDGLAELEQMGCVFLGDVRENGNKLYVTITGLRDEPSAQFASLMAEYGPRLFVDYYDEDGRYVETDIIPFPMTGGASSTVAVDVSGYGGCGMIILDNGEESANIVSAMWNNNVGDYDFFYYEYGVAYVGDPIVFDDVPEDTWYAEYVYSAASMGLVYGKGENMFEPHSNMTYAEAITLAVRMHLIFNGMDPDYYFDGESSKPWYQMYVDYARRNGIAWNYPNYNANITRADYIHIFHTALPEDVLDPMNDIADGAVPDVSMSAKYADEIYDFYRAGILTGNDSNGTFAPNSNIKRNEVATILCRIFYIDRKEFTL